MRPVSVTASDAERDPGVLETKWREVSGGHKWLHYFRFYEETVGAMASAPLRLLEIGVYKGASLKMWSRYLPAGSVVVGIDIDPATSKFDAPANSVFVRVGDQADQAFLKSVVQELGPFDVIVDDGSHVASHMISSFCGLFLAGLNPGGLYLVEDTHTNYWALPYRDQDYSFMDFSKDLVDTMHAAYFAHPSTEYFAKGSPQRVQTLELPKIGAAIEEVRFRDSLVAVFRKRDPAHLPLTEHR